MNNSPFFSVIIPTYNRVHIIRRAIDSVLAQTFKDFELIIVDDGSTDNTEEIVSSYADTRIIYHYQSNSGVCTARNTGAKIASSKWLCFLDSDDFVSENWLGDFWMLIDDGNFDLLFCGMEVISANDKKSKIELPSKRYSNGDVWWLHNVGVWIIKAHIFNKVGGYDSNLTFGENTELGIRIMDEKPKVGIIDKFNFSYCASDDGGSQNFEEIVRCNALILSKHPKYFANNTIAKQKLEQSSGVVLIRLGRFKEGKLNLWKGWMSRPFEFRAFLRALIGSLPKVAHKVWKPILR